MKRKRILVLSPYFPYPPYDGGKNRLYNLIRNLADHHDVYLLSYRESSVAEDDIRAMARCCAGVFTVLRDESTRLTEGDVPRSATFFYTPAMIRELERVVAAIRPDVVQIDFLIMTPYTAHLDGIPLCYTEHDMSSINFEQSFHDRDLPEKERFVAWCRMVSYQKKVLRRFSHVMVLTERDRTLLEEFAPGLKTVLAPTGVDTGYFAPQGRPAAKNRTVFVGHYRHHPNLDAVQYYLDHIFPLIRAARPDAEFTAVGSGATPELLARRAPGIEVTDTVADVRPHLSAGRVFVASVRLGGGIKGKILEAMASGVPVVALPESAAGIAAVPGTHLLLAESPEEFAAATVSLLSDDALAGRLAAAGRILVEERYDWKNIAGGLARFYDTLA